MEMKFAQRMDRLLPSGIRKVNERALAMEREGETVLHFEIGRPDFDTPEYIKQACIQSLERGEVFYTSNFGDMELRREIATYLTKRCRVEYRAEEILVTVGLSEAIFDVLSAILDEGDEILVPDPTWINYVNVPRMLGAVPVNYALEEQRNYQPDTETLEKLITSRTKAIVLVSPNNPTGSVLEAETVKQIAELAIRHGLYVLSDEVYERLLYDGAEHISIASLAGMKERTIVLNGFSKAYSMTGWRIGYLAAPEEMVREINKIHQHNVTCAASFVQKAAITALRDEKDEVREMVAEYEKRRNYAVRAINATEGISCTMPQGAFYIFINIRATGRDCETVAKYLLEEKKIALIPGTVFGKRGEGYLRMSFANSYENVVEGIRRLREGIEELRRLS